MGASCRGSLSGAPPLPLQALLGWDLALQGGECFGYFMQWGLPKEALKSIWEVVAGDEGRLTQGQFLSCIYLMDLAKRGRPLPQRLPPGAFPPVAPAAPAPGAQRALSLSGMQGVRLSRCRRAFPVSADQLGSIATPKTGNLHVSQLLSKVARSQICLAELFGEDDLANIIDQLICICITR